MLHIIFDQYSGVARFWCRYERGDNVHKTQYERVHVGTAPTCLLCIGGFQWWNENEE